MLKNSAVLILMLFFCGASVRAEKFNHIGTVRFCGLSQFTERATKLLENVDPALKAYPLMLSIYIAMNPQYNSFDFSETAAVYYYQPQEKISPKPYWCISVRRASGRPLDEFELQKQRLYTKYFDNRVLISDNRALLATFSAPPAIPPGKGHEVEMEFEMAKYAAGMPDDLNLIFHWLEKNIVRKAAGGNGRNAAARLASLHGLLKQTEKISLTADVKPEELDLSLELIPLPGSQFGEFIVRQSINPRLLPAPDKDKELAVSFNLADYPSAWKALADTLAGLKTECNTEEQQDYCRLLEAVLAGSNGSGVFYADSHGKPGMPQTFARMLCADKAAAEKVRREIAAIKRFKPLPRDLFLVYSLVSLEDEKSSDNLFCAIRGDSFYMVGCGGDAEAEKITDDAAAQPMPLLDRKGMMFSQVNINGKPGAVADLTCSQTMTLKLRIMAPMLRRLIPAPGPKGKGHRAQMTFELGK